MVAREELHPELLSPPGYKAIGAPDDPRIGDHLSQSDSLAEGGVAIIGFPVDVGVRRNGGRPGAAGGPAAFRAAFARLTPLPFIERSIDLGDVNSDALEAAQDALAQVVEAVLRAGGVPLVIGGGHETAFGHFLGCLAASGSLDVLNWDAHADVRPLIDGRGHSGSPFRQMIEHDAGTRYIVAGLLEHAVADEHVRYVRASGGKTFFRGETAPAKVYGLLDRPTMVSFDLDAVDGAWAPGVSAPAVGGLSVDEWLRAAHLAGTNEFVRSADIVELNPAFDLDGQTARLAALTAWTFIRGLAGRNKP